MIDHILRSAKAYAALIGAVLTALLASGLVLPSWLGAVAAVCTAVATYAIPNAMVAPAGVEMGDVFDEPGNQMSD